MKKSPEAFRTISEVAEWLGTPAHVLRFWESRFSQIKPVKRAGGRRYYRPSDMMLLGGIRRLLHDDGMTIRGVKRLLQEKGVKHVAALSGPLDQPQTEAARAGHEEAGLNLDAEQEADNILILDRDGASAEDTDTEEPPVADEPAEETEIEAEEEPDGADQGDDMPELPFVHHPRPTLETKSAVASVPADPVDPDPANMAQHLPEYTTVIAGLRRFARRAGASPLPEETRDQLVSLQQRLSELRAR